MSTQLVLNTERIRSFRNRISASLCRVFTAASPWHYRILQEKRNSTDQLRGSDSATLSDRCPKRSP